MYDSNGYKIRKPEYFILDSQYLTKASIPDFRYNEVKDTFTSKAHFLKFNRIDYIQWYGCEGFVIMAYGFYSGGGFGLFPPFSIQSY